MATLHESSRTGWDGKPFWGLVQQNGPWRATKADRQRASRGGGHDGNANSFQVMTPYQIDATGAPPLSSAYASVMMAPVDMKRQTKMGRVKTRLTLHARTPMQTGGHKMGMATQTDDVMDGQILGAEPGDLKPTVSIEATSPFVSEHHVMEMPSSAYSDSTDSSG